jgi:alpha-L-rhamnosidase
MIYDHMMYFGDKVLVKRYLGTVDGIFDYFNNRIDERGLVGQFDPEM